MIKSFWRWLFGPRLPARLDYETAMAALDATDVATRAELAARADTKPEMLYYLAGDGEARVRRRIAANPATPLQADRLLAQDPDGEVRAELAAKIGRLLPGLAESERERLRELTIDVLEKLAADQLTRVRAILAEEIKASDRIPKAIIQKLARDVELVVAAPILEYSPLLNDTDLLELIAHGAVSGALAAVARRRAVSTQVADAVVASLDIPAVAALLKNPKADIRDDTMQTIIDHAEAIQAWHGPIVMRADLSLRAMRRVAGFVASSLVRHLQERRGLDDEMATFLAKRVKERLAEEEAANPTREASEAVRRAAAHGLLDDAFIVEAVEAKDRLSIIQALGVMTRQPPALVEKILDGPSAKAVVALCWHAGLTMRTAIKVQTFATRLAQKDVIQARHGTDYPMSDEEMAWQLDLFGISADPEASSRR